MFILKDVMYGNHQYIFLCDGKCEKAWGKQTRKTNQISDNEDDWEYLSDNELGEAPADPGTYEGGHGKPTISEHPAPNKWCIRECERSCTVLPGKILEVSDFNYRISNKRGN